MSVERVERWASAFAAAPSRDLADDARALAAWHASSASVLEALAGEGGGEEVERARAAWRKAVRDVHAPFVRRHKDAILALTPEREVASMVTALAAALPGLLPSAEELAAEAKRPLAGKIGFEYKTAVLFAELLADPRAGGEIMQASRVPRAAAREALERLRKDDAVELTGARIRREGRVGVVEITSPNVLNAESEATLADLETCVDLVALDDRIDVATLRGAPVASSKYAGQRVFCSGLDLTGLHGGKLSYLYYVRRELGLVSKIYRGVHDPARGEDVEKAWIAVVDKHAIGGGCQLLLVVDYVLAERAAVLTLPARREGIIPGAANLRLSRIVGERAARRALLLDEAIPVTSYEGRLLVDALVDPENMEEAIARVVRGFVDSSLISLAANRKAQRIAQEPLETFREYMAHFALAQADCHFSGALVRNLERHWTKRAAAAKA